MNPPDDETRHEPEPIEKSRPLALPKRPCPQTKAKKRLFKEGEGLSSAGSFGRLLKFAPRKTCSAPACSPSAETRARSATPRSSSSSAHRPPPSAGGARYRAADPNGIRSPKRLASTARASRNLRFFDVETFDGDRRQGPAPSLDQVRRRPSRPAPGPKDGPEPGPNPAGLRGWSGLGRVAPPNLPSRMTAGAEAHHPHSSGKSYGACPILAPVPSPSWMELESSGGPRCRADSTAAVEAARIEFPRPEGQGAGSRARSGSGSGRLVPEGKAGLRPAVSKRRPRPAGSNWGPRVGPRREVAAGQAVGSSAGLDVTLPGSQAGKAGHRPNPLTAGRPTRLFGDPLFGRSALPWRAGRGSEDVRPPLRRAGNIPPSTPGARPADKTFS